MKLLENSRFTGTALLLLLALNSILLVLLVLKKPDGATTAPNDGLRGHGGPKDFLIRELSLDEKQKASYLEMVEVHHSRVLAIEAEVRQLRDSMVNQLESAVPDTILISRLAKKVGDDQTELDQITFDHFRELRSILRPDQQAKFEKVISEALHMMGRPGGPGRGEGGPPPPPEGR